MFGIILIGSGLLFFSVSQSFASAPVNQHPPFPWKPMKVLGQSVMLTDKVLILSASGVPAQITVNDQTLLSRQVTMTAGGQPLIPENGNELPQLKLADGGGRLDYTTSLVTTVADKKIKFLLTGVVEFDGLVSLTLSSLRLPEVMIGKDIIFRATLKANSVRFMHRWAEVGQRNIDLSKAANDLIQSAYIPFFWLGNDSNGLYWFSETNVGWGNAQNKNAIRVYRDEDGWNIRITIRPTPFKDGSWQYRFGFMPTPVKALPGEWRKLRLAPAHSATAYVIWPNEKEAAMSYFGYPESTRPVALSSYLNNLLRGGVIGLPYACPTWISTNTSEWRQHQQEWASGVSDKSFEGSEWGGQFVNVCPARASWKQFVRNRFGRFIDQYKLSGLYMDNAQVYATRACLDTEMRPDAREYPMLDQRELYRFIMTKLHGNATRTFALVHSSGGLNLPSFSVVDAWVDGEQYRDLVKSDYLDVATLTDFRVELNAAHWGVVPIFLPEFSAEQSREVAPTRKLMSILLLHDVIPWPQWANVQEINRGLDMLDAFGVADAEFVPYYAEQPVAHVNKLGLYVSGYRRGTATLMIVANLTKTALVDQLCPSSGDVPQSGKLQTWPARDPIMLSQGCAKIEIPAGSYAMYQAERASVIRQ